MALQIGIVGLPNVGKSTLFKALTKKSILIANYPFATIDPNVGVVEVNDARLSALAALHSSEKIIPTAIEFVDIAGLVKGASEGEGLGNKFLQHIREVDAIAQVVRSFADPNIIHVHGSPDAVRDADIINVELALADFTTVEKRIQKLHGEKKAGVTKDMERLEGVLTRIHTALQSATPVRALGLDADEYALINDLHLLTAKPMLYVVNTDEGEESLEKTPVIVKHGEPVIGISAKIEAELAELPADEAKEMMQSLGMNESGLDKLIRSGYELLNLITYFTCGPKETRAWTISKGTKAPQAAGKIHSDFERGFIAAEVVFWKDLVDAGSESAAKAKGLLRTEGKEYVFKDGDVTEFLFNV